MFLEKSLFDSFNGFDENIFLYEEELELQYRFFCAGFQNYYVDKVGINHLEGKSSSSFFKRKCSFISNCYIYNLHFLNLNIISLEQVIHAVPFWEFLNPKVLEW